MDDDDTTWRTDCPIDGCDFTVLYPRAVLDGAKLVMAHHMAEAHVQVVAVAHDG